MDILFLRWICECVEATKQICERWSNSYPGLVHEDMHYPWFVHNEWHALSGIRAWRHAQPGIHFKDECWSKTFVYANFFKKQGRGFCSEVHSSWTHTAHCSSRRCLVLKAIWRRVLFVRGVGLPVSWGLVGVSPLGYLHLVLGRRVLLEADSSAAQRLSHLCKTQSLVSIEVRRNYCASVQDTEPC